MDYPALKKQFDRDGYIVLDSFFEPAQVAHLDGLIRRHYGTDPELQHSNEFLTRSQTDVIPWFPQQQGVTDFDVVQDNPRLKLITDTILGDDWYGEYCMVMFSGPGSQGQAWHQDCPPEHPQRFNLNRLVYTSDVDDGTGGQVVVVPGSHRMGLLPPGDPSADLDGQVLLRPRQGTLICLHGHTWHRVLPIKDTVRASINYRSAAAGTPEGITDVCVYRNMRYRFSTASVIEERAV